MAAVTKKPNRKPKNPMAPKLPKSNPEFASSNVRSPKQWAEAPDRGLSEQEAPEIHHTIHAEAPDWGEQRADSLASPFTEGRSQS